MSHVLPVLLLGVCTIFGLLLVPVGLPGLWVMVAGIVGYGWLTDFRSVGVATIGVALGLAFPGEIIEWWLGFRFARTYGGSRRSAWGALVGGIVGAAMGVPVPIVGSMIGAFLGSFAGAVVFEYSLSRTPGTAVRVGWAPWWVARPKPRPRSRWVSSSPSSDCSPHCAAEPTRDP